MKQETILTLANKITILRIVLIPIIVIGLLKSQSAWVLVLLGFCMLTDFLDGLAARLKGERTRLGAFLDPLADKLLLTAVFLTLAFQHRIEMWVFVVVFSRDLLIVLGWSVLYILTGQANITPRWLGKTTTTLQMLTVLSVLLNLPMTAQNIFIWATVLLTAASAIDYIRIGEKRLGE